jgi:hypothetical protein
MHKRDQAWDLATKIEPSTRHNQEGNLSANVPGFGRRDSRDLARGEMSQSGSGSFHLMVMVPATRQTRSEQVDG